MEIVKMEEVWSWPSLAFEERSPPNFKVSGASSTSLLALLRKHNNITDYSSWTWDHIPMIPLFGQPWDKLSPVKVEGVSPLKS